MINGRSGRVSSHRVFTNTALVDRLTPTQNSLLDHLDWAGRKGISPGRSIRLGCWRQNAGVSGRDPGSSRVHPVETKSGGGVLVSAFDKNTSV